MIGNDIELFTQIITSAARIAVREVRQVRECSHVVF